MTDVVWLFHDFAFQTPRVVEIGKARRHAEALRPEDRGRECISITSTTSSFTSYSLIRFSKYPFVASLQ